ncbi:MAG TPA: hypothetical protein VFM51_04055 [Solirubrobacterales bacterium]|nr:hypothetical protein [Solirubrobacterales bacterium]
MKDLSRPRVRLDRAKVHSQKFGEVWHSFVKEEEPYYPIVTTDDDGEGTIFVRASNSFPGEQLSLHFGEMLYQLRAALDSLVYEVAILDSGCDPPPNEEQLEFIIRDSAEKFDNAAWKIKPLSDQHRAMIHSVQPYDIDQRGEAEAIVASALNELNDLARKDRHRGLRVIASWISNKNPSIETLPPGCSLEWLKVTEDGLLKEEGEVASFKIRGWLPEHELEANPNCAIDVAIEDAGPPLHDGDTLFSRTRMMIGCVSEVIRGFEESFD